MSLTKLNHPTLGDIVFHRWEGHVPHDNQMIIEHNLSKPEFTWAFTKSTIDEGTNPDEFLRFDDVSMLVHLLVTSKGVVSNYFHSLIEFIGVDKLISKHNLSGEILTARVNLFIQRDRIVNPCPHIDVPHVPHYSILYYVNDSDGDTIFYDKSEGSQNLGEMREWRRESPKKGDILIFDGRIYHSPSCPVKSTHRISVNFDMLYK
tara:strand:- start:35 stop:649 length:615 start_codon:yes stop_codon:yes gene_type:complete